MAGLPSKYAKMGFKKGWKACKASKRGRSVKNMPKRRNYSRARARGRSYKQKPIIPLSLAVPLVASALIEPKAGWNTPFNMAQAVLSGQTQYTQNIADQLLDGWLFYDRGKNAFDLSGGLYTKLMLLGAAVHWVAGKTGINRAIARTKIPYVRI